MPLTSVAVGIIDKHLNPYGIIPITVMNVAVRNWN